MELIPFTEDHFAELASWFANEREVVLWVGPATTHPVDAIQLASFLAEGRSTPPLRHCWMATDGTELLGHVHLRYDWRNGNATISGVAIAPRHRRRGHAAPMLDLVIRKAFADPRIERLDLNVFTINTIAIHLYERLGFTREGVQRSCVRVGDERWDRLTMSILRRRRRHQPETEALPRTPPNAGRLDRQ